MKAGSVNLAKLVADEQSAPISKRLMMLNDGTIIVHEVSNVSWQDVARYMRRDGA